MNGSFTSKLTAESRIGYGWCLASFLALLASGCTMCPGIVDCASPLRWHANLTGLSDADVTDASLHFCRNDACVTAPVDPSWQPGSDSSWLISSNVVAQDGGHVASVEYTGPVADGDDITIEVRAADGHLLAERHAVVEHYDVSEPFGPSCGQCVSAELVGVDPANP